MLQCTPPLTQSRISQKIGSPSAPSLKPPLKNHTVRLFEVLMKIITVNVVIIKYGSSPAYSKPRVKVSLDETLNFKPKDLKPGYRIL